MSALKAAAVRDQQGVTLFVTGGLVVLRDVEGHDLARGERAAERLDVREPAGLVLQVVIRLGDHVRVDPEPDHDRERVALDAARQFHLDPADVDRPRLTLQGTRERSWHVAERHVEVAREQVAGSEGDDPQLSVGFHVGEVLSRGAYRAVAAGHDDQIGSCRERILGRTLTGVLPRGLHQLISGSCRLRWHR